MKAISYNQKPWRADGSLVMHKRFTKQELLRILYPTDLLIPMLKHTLHRLLLHILLQVRYLKKWKPSSPKNGLPCAEIKTMKHGTSGEEQVIPHSLQFQSAAFWGRAVFRQDFSIPA